MNMQSLIDYYSREDIQQAMLRVAKDREVVGVFSNGSFAKRPNTIQYPQDIVSMIRQGVMEFHCSLERWSQPMALQQENYSELRKGWDMILDLDCKIFEHGKAAAIVLCRALEKHDIKGYSVKYTGGKGFHIGVPWESIPSEVNYKLTANQFPELARQIAQYLKNFLKKDLEKELLKRFGTPEKIAEQMQIPVGKIMAIGDSDNPDSRVFDPFKVVDIDSVLISPRHLFRMPYSLHKGSFFVSLPIQPDELDDFRKEYARPDKVKPDLGFLNMGKAGEAEILVGEAVDWHTRKDIKKKRERLAPVGLNYAIKKVDFPPCIHNILNGLPDGRKRAVFILTNFLSSAGWSLDAMEKLLIDWNKKNKPPMRDNYIRTHIRWHEGRIRSGQKKLPPPGCAKDGYYMSLNVCKPDAFCGGQAKTIKNPTNYALRKDEQKKEKQKSKGKGKRKKREKTVYIE